MNPELVSARDLDPNSIGQFAWDTTLNTKDLEYGSQGSFATWKQAHVGPGEVAARIWVPVQSLARFHSGDFRWDFQLEHIGEGQIGVGFMLDWTVGPDWGFYGYLGSSSSAWAYDPTSGDVVVNTRSIEGGLPVLSSGQGVVSVEAHLPREKPGLARFVVDGKTSRPIELPEGSVLVPAACFLVVGQSVTLQNLRRDALDTSNWSGTGKPPDTPPSDKVPETSSNGLIARLKKKFFGS